MRRSYSVCVCVFCVCLQAFYYPPDAGLPMGGPGSSRFLRLEVHYHNPLLISGVYSAHMNTTAWSGVLSHILFFDFYTHTHRPHTQLDFPHPFRWAPGLSAAERFIIHFPDVPFDLACASRWSLCLTYPDMTSQYTHFFEFTTHLFVWVLLCYDHRISLQASQQRQRKTQKCITLKSLTGIPKSE